jgi:anti-sigma factor RsiW
MSHSEDQSTLHPAAKLLPWYVNGTLKESERRDVDHHVASCADCRRELDELSTLRAPLKQAFAETTMPTSRVKERVMAHVLAGTATGSQASPPPESGIAESLERWLRRLFAPRWAPALAVAMLIGQLALLLWAVGPQTPLTATHIATRGIPDASNRIVVVFQDSVPEGRIRKAIASLQGRIVDGPTADGRYTIEVPASLAGTLDQRLQTLRQQSAVVRSAERLSR